MTTFFLRHFETEIDPEEPVDEWDLSEDGIAAMETFLDRVMIAPHRCEHTVNTQRHRLTSGPNCASMATETTVEPDSTSCHRPADFCPIRPYSVP